MKTALVSAELITTQKVAPTTALRRLSRLADRLLGEAARIGRRLHEADFARAPFNHRHPPLPAGNGLRLRPASLELSRPIRA